MHTSGPAAAAGKRALVGPSSEPGRARVNPRDRVDVSVTGVCTGAWVCTGETHLRLTEMQTPITKTSTGRKMVMTAQF